MGFLCEGTMLDAVNGETVASVPFKKVMSRIKAAGLTFHQPIDGQAETFSSRSSVDPAPVRRARASTAGPTDYDDLKGKAAAGSGDDEYVDAATELQSLQQDQMTMSTSTLLLSYSPFTFCKVQPSCW